jgi:acyl-CoA thioesterase
MTDSDPAELLAHKGAAAIWAADTARRFFEFSLVEVGPGNASIAMAVRPDMLGANGQCARWAIFLLAELAMTIACNTHGQSMVTQRCEIAFLDGIGLGDPLTATASERHYGEDVGLYDVSVRTPQDRVVAELRGEASRA